MEKVSIIVPVYNTESYLERCIRSIVEQTYENLEILLIDDGSTDKSAVICDEWGQKDKRIRVCHRKMQGGVSATRNQGIQLATGEWVMMVDSDDYLCEEAVGRMAETMSDTNADLVICDFDQGEEEHFLFELEEGSAEVITPIEAYNRIYRSSKQELQYVVPWAKLYKKVLFSGISYPDGKIFEDIYVTHHLLAKCTRIAVMPQVLCYYFVRDDSIMHQKFHKKKLDYLDALVDRIAFFDEMNLPELKTKAYDKYVHALVWEYSRVRDILHETDVLRDIKARFRKVYRLGYSSKMFKAENRRFLFWFYVNPELVALGWRMSAVKDRLLRKEK